MFDDILFGTPLTKRTIEETIKELKREYVFDVDFAKYETNTPIDTKAIFIKGDKNTSILRATLLKNKVPIDLTGYTVTANIKENRSETTTIACTVLNATTGVIEINLPDVYVDKQGDNLFEIVLQKNEKVTISQQYKYTVLDSLGEGTIGDETQLTVLQSLIQQVQESKTTVDTIVAELEVTQSDIDDILEMVGGL